MAGPALSRRSLLFRLPAAARERLDAAASSGARPADAAAAPAAVDYRVLGRRLEPAAERIVRASAIAPGKRLLDLHAGDGNVALAAARAGADVVAVRVGDAESLPLDDASFDCVASNFGVIHARDGRRAVGEIDRVLRPGGSVLVTAWASAGVMGRILRLAAEVERRGPADARPERWGRYEGVQLAFSRFPGFEVHDMALRWEFASADRIWEELVAPPGPLAAAARRDGALRERLMQLVEPFARREGEHLVLKVAYVMAVAHKPEWAAVA